ncbi:hypothetical protein SUDANB121_03391 [Nocardiopsis dassonvillei]
MSSYGSDPATPEKRPRSWPAVETFNPRNVSVSQSSAALLGRVPRMAGAPFSPSRSRHTRPALFGFRHRSGRVRRYAENPPPARRSALRTRRESEAPTRSELRPAPSGTAFDASGIEPARPYCADHERRRSEHPADRFEAETRVRLARWSIGREPSGPSAPRATVADSADRGSPITSSATERRPVPVPAPPTSGPTPREGAVCCSSKSCPQPGDVSRATTPGRRSPSRAASAEAGDRGAGRPPAPGPSAALPPQTTKESHAESIP